jgi:catechol 2,3-dioxygenase-like lactoylglutathione lyase family enzyme
MAGESGQLRVSWGMKCFTRCEGASMKAEHDDSEMIGLCHVGMHARNPAALAEFYRDVMGMQVVGGSDASHPLGLSAFLSSRPSEESHEIAMFANPQFAHYAFKVASLSALRRFYQRIVQRGIPIQLQLLHGVSIAFYFQDPEGNMIEVYWPTGVNHPQPCAQPIDLTCPEAELLAKLAAMTSQAPIPAADRR